MINSVRLNWERKLEIIFASYGPFNMSVLNTLWPLPVNLICILMRHGHVENKLSNQMRLYSFLFYLQLWSIYSLRNAFSNWTFNLLTKPLEMNILSFLEEPFFTSFRRSVLTSGIKIFKLSSAQTAVLSIMRCPVPGWNRLLRRV